MNPRSPLSSTMAKIAAASSQSSNIPETAAAPIRTQTMMLANCDKNSLSAEGGGTSGRSFHPYSARRRQASFRPASGAAARSSLMAAPAGGEDGRPYDKKDQRVEADGEIDP